jgi:hypothetical protein
MRPDLCTRTGDAALDDVGGGARWRVGYPFAGHAGCGCDKPAPARAAIRSVRRDTSERRITLFSANFVEGQTYKVEFASLDSGVSDWSAGKARVKRDLADAEPRVQLAVASPTFHSARARITVVNRAGVVMQLPDTEFTVTGDPIPLHDFAESITRQRFKAGVSGATERSTSPSTSPRSATRRVSWRRASDYELAFGPTT